MVEFTLAAVLANFWDAVVIYLPNVVSAIILLAIGLIVGKIAGRVVKQVLDQAKIDSYISENKKPIVSVSTMLSLIVKWWVYLAFITAASDVLRIIALADWVATINAFIPRIIGASIIIFAGYALGEYIKEQIKKTETIYANIVGKVTLFFIVYMAVAMALPVLGISATLVNSIMLIIVGSMGVGLAIALGLGLKVPVEMVAKRYLQKSKVLR